MESYPIHIAFCINDAYAKYVCVTIKSIVDNHPNDDVTIHILSDYISEKSKCRLSEALIGAESHISIVYHWMNDMDYEGLLVKKKWPICAWYRLSLDSVLSVDIHRVLYLDADTVVAANLLHLFQLNMENNSIAAVPDMYSVWGELRATRLGYEESRGYVCSGVLLINLDYWRVSNLSKKSFVWARNHSDILVYPDQDVLNVMCLNSKKVLPLNYAVASYFFNYELPYEEHLAELKECVEHPVIVHYIDKTWYKETCQTHPLHKIWHHYNRLLKHPVRIEYESKGWIRLKVQVWRLLHPYYEQSRRITIKNIMQKIELYESGAANKK
jgi:lipopolysaccharide biosynthesis glycosyltransferase